MKTLIKTTDLIFWLITICISTSDAGEQKTDRINKLFGKPVKGSK